MQKRSSANQNQWKRIRFVAYRLLALGALAALAACGGHSSGHNYSVGGSISGLRTDGLVLQNNIGNNLTIAANATSFHFLVASGGDYNITVAAQPTGLTCTVSHGAGTNVNEKIVNVIIVCNAATHTIAGTITGLTTNGLVLQNNGADDLAIAANAAAFEFTTPVAYGGSYAVTVLTQPAGQSCSIVNASSTALAQVSNVAVTCASAQFIQFRGHNMIISEEQIAKESDAGSPLYFVFVNNTSTQNPDGSYEHPYPTLALAGANSAPNNIIYVFPGDGTTAGMDAGVVLQADQKFWGAGVSHVIPTSRGDVIIPSEAASAPIITNTAGDGITLAMDNDVSGFIVSNAVGNGIFGSNPTDIKISASTFVNSLADQIHLEYSTASGSIIFDNLMLTNGGQAGIFIDSTAASALNFTLNNSVIQGSAANAINASFADAASVQLTNDTVEGNYSSGSIAFGGSATLIVSGNAFNNNTSISDAALSIIAGSIIPGAHPLSAVIASNTISGNTSGAVRFILNDAESTLSLTGNTITNNGTGSIASLGAAILINPNNTSSGNCNLVLSDNTISGNTGSALYGFSGGFNNFQVTAINNSVVGNGRGGFVFANAANSFSLTATDNTISGGGDNGIMTAGGVAMTTAHVTLTNNKITGNTNFANGVAFSHTGTNLYFVATNNVISDNEASGILMYASSAIENVVASIKNNTISNNQNLPSNTSGGIDLEQFTNLSADLDNNTLSNNVSSDVFIESTEASPWSCVTMNGNNSNMGYVFSSGTGIFNLAPIDVAAVNSGAITTLGTITAVQSCPKKITEKPDL